MKVAVLGATGSTGALVVDRLMARGHHAVALSRSPAPAREPSSRFTQHTGDLTDHVLLHEWFAGCDAVIACVGQNRASKSLFAKRTSPPDILRRIAAAAIEAIGEGPQHLVYLSAFGVGADRRQHALLFRIVLRLSSIHDAYLDHAEAETIIRASPAAWTIVRPPGLTDTDQEVPLIDKSNHWSSFETVSKRSLASFLVSCAEQHSPIGQIITVGEASNKR
jgi:uncharacterized protein YbjT (DUF2867 family)